MCSRVVGKKCIMTRGLDALPIPPTPCDPAGGSVRVVVIPGQVRDCSRRERSQSAAGCPTARCLAPTYPNRSYISALNRSAPRQTNRWPVGKGRVGQPSSNRRPQGRQSLHVTRGPCLHVREAFSSCSPWRLHCGPKHRARALGLGCRSSERLIYVNLKTTLV